MWQLLATVLARLPRLGSLLLLRLRWPLALTDSSATLLAPRRCYYDRYWVHRRRRASPSSTTTCSHFIVLLACDCACPCARPIMLLMSAVLPLHYRSARARLSAKTEAAQDFVALRRLRGILAVLRSVEGKSDPCLLARATASPSDASVAAVSPF